MINSPLGYRESALYGVFPVGRVVTVVLQAQTRDFGRRIPWDFSDNVKWQIHLRVAPYPLVAPVVFDRDYVMEKLNANTARARVILPIARSLVHVEWVAVELDVDDGDDPITVSGKKEWALDLPWIATAPASPRP